jgi:hypothetical protein
MYQYVIEHYQPDRLIGSHWFWKKRQTAFKFNPDRVGNFGHLENLCTRDFCQAIASGKPLEASIYKKSWGISGVAILLAQNKPADAVYLMDVSRHQLIAVSSVNPDSR